MTGQPKAVDVAHFIANWPDIVRDLGSGATQGVDVTRDGEVIAVIRPPPRSLHGFLRGSVQIPDGCDLTVPVSMEETHAETGRVHE